MKLNGIQTQEVTVDVKPMDCLKAVADYLGVGNLVFPSSRNTSYRWREVCDKKGRIVEIVSEHDISYHGTSCWQPTGDVISDKEKIATYCNIKKLKNMMENKSKEK